MLTGFPGETDCQVPTCCCPGYVGSLWPESALALGQGSLGPQQASSEQAGGDWDVR